MVTEVDFFGYGANRDQEMMEAIIGRKPEGYEAEVTGYELGIQEWKEIPYRVRKELSPNWKEGFKSYCLVPSEHKKKAKVKGMVWKITKAERRLIDRWELTGLWYKVYLLEFISRNDKKFQIELQVMDQYPVSAKVNGKRYRTFLNNRGKMLRIARSLRKV